MAPFEAADIREKFLLAITTEQLMGRWLPDEALADYLAASSTTLVGLDKKA